METAGYSGTPLVKKLGIRPGARCLTRGAPGTYADLVGPLPEGARFLTRGDGLDFIHVFVTRRAELERHLRLLPPRMAPTGMLWISWPKKTSGTPTEVTGSDVRDAGLSTGLVDVKVCAIDATWSGLKFVVRRKDRPT